MAITARKPTLWRGGFENRPGALAEVLGPLADAAGAPTARLSSEAARPYDDEQLLRVIVPATIVAR